MTTRVPTNNGKQNMDDEVEGGVNDISSFYIFRHFSALLFEKPK